MCECGCSIGSVDYKIPGPKNSWYGIRIYSGCSNCVAPAGIDIFKLNSEDYEMMGGESAPLLDFFENQASLALLDANFLVQPLREYGIDVDSLNECDLFSIVRSAVSSSHQKYQDILKQNKK